LDELEATKGPIEIEDSEERQKLMAALQSRIEGDVKSGNYSRLERLHRLYDRFTEKPRPESDALSKQIESLEARRKDLIKRKKDLEDEKAAAIKAFKEKRSEKRKKLVADCEAAVLKAEDEYPPRDAPEYRSRSRQLLDLWDDAERYARARDYTAARAVQRRANVLKAEECKAHYDEWALACQRIREQALAKNEAVLAAFDQRTAAKEQAITPKYDTPKHDKPIEALERMIQSVTKQIQVLYVRAGKLDDES
jgi:hypothetical protein